MVIYGGEAIPPMTTADVTHTFAVQPAYWDNFDQHACWWAESINHAYRIAQFWGEPCMIWMCPEKGEPIRWCRADANTDAIADLVFGV